jgi:acetyl esterase
VPGRIPRRICAAGRFGHQEFILTCKSFEPIGPAGRPGEVKMAKSTTAATANSEGNRAVASDLIATLDPAVVPYLEALKRGAVPIATSTVKELRDGAKALRAGWQRSGPAMHATVDGRFEGMRFRIYRPSARERLPAVVFFHGGGWTLMDIDTHDPIARFIAMASGAAVLSLDYPLAPEAPFPAALGACTRFARYVAGAADSLGLAAGGPAFAGDSAGANLAVAVALALRDAGAFKPSALALIYGSYDLSTLARDSHRRFGDGTLPLSIERMTFFRDSYVPNVAERTDPLVSPLRADLSGLPPCFLAVASHDALYDENFAFAARLGAAGVPVELKIYPGTIHGFLEAAAAVDAPVAKQALADVGQFLAKGFG